MKNRIKAIVAVPEIGEIYEGKVKSIMTYGAFIEILPGKDGLLHISEISWERLESMDGVFKEGETVQVKLIDIDPKSGKLKLSKKALIPREKSGQNSPQGGQNGEQGNKPQRRVPTQN